jgi:hypothetical protein
MQEIHLNIISFKSEIEKLSVTTMCPEMVAEMYPHFENEHLSDFGKNNLWFLNNKNNNNIAK